MIYTKDEIVLALKESNEIEGVTSDQALRDAYDAWKILAKARGTGVTTKKILEVHKTLMKNIDPTIAGKWRDDVVYIGGRQAHYINEALLVEEVKTFIRDFKLKKEIGDINNEKLYEECKKSHIQFEFVHPFFDGNGRTGRILYYYQMQRLRLPLKIINNNTKHLEYYPWFRIKQ